MGFYNPIVFPTTGIYRNQMEKFGRNCPRFPTVETKIFKLIIHISECGFRISEWGIRILENCDTMGERMGRIGRICTDFFEFIFKIQAKLKKIRTNPPDPPHPFSHSITILFHTPHSPFRNQLMSVSCLRRKANLCIHLAVTVITAYAL